MPVVFSSYFDENSSEPTPSEIYSNWGVGDLIFRREAFRNSSTRWRTIGGASLQIVGTSSLLSLGIIETRLPNGTLEAFYAKYFWRIENKSSKSPHRSGFAKFQKRISNANTCS